MTETFVTSPPSGTGRRHTQVRVAAVLVLFAMAGAVAEASDPNPVPLLREARSERASGDLDRALKLLARAERGPLADHVALLRMRWLRERGDADAALAIATAAFENDPPSELRALLHVEQAQIHLENDLREAFEAQRKAWQATRSGTAAAKFAYEFAQVFEQRQLPGDALQLYRQVWTQWPRSEVGAFAFERSSFLTRATGAPPPSARELLGYADALRTSYLCEAALAVYERALSSDQLDLRTQERAERGHADCLFRSRRYQEAKQAYEAIAAADPDDVDAAIRAARADARAGHMKEAVEALSRIARTAPPAQRARAQYLVAIVASERDPVSSRRLLERVERQRESAGLARLARWRLAWADLRASEHDSALKRLRPLTRGSVYDVEVQRARYWSAVAALERDPEAAERGLRELAEEVPLSYYGLLAADRLQIPPLIERSFLDTDSLGEIYIPEQRAGWLLDAGFPELARAELESWFQSEHLKRAERLAAARLLHALGDHFRAVRLLIDGFGGALDQGVDPLWREAWHHAWPQPFIGAVSAAVREFDFDAALVYAVMREESTYRPEVESPAGALGLMQIIPPTAGRIARSLGVEPFAPPLLFEPSTNVRFGTYYLKHLIGLYQGSHPHAIAAYNAGPDAVNDWLERDGKLPEDAFVDSVPYSETRRYLRKVLRSWRVYQLLYRGTRATSTQQSGSAVR